jgi:hypothetical protein
MGLLAVFTIDDFLSLHDIRADYVSTAVFQYLDIPMPEGLPSWTATRLEWASVTVSYVVRSLLIASNIAILTILYRKAREQPCPA